MNELKSIQSFNEFSNLRIVLIDIMRAMTVELINFIFLPKDLTIN